MKKYSSILLGLFFLLPNVAMANLVVNGTFDDGVNDAFWR
jgi:hypothetical protein